LGELYGQAPFRLVSENLFHRNVVEKELDEELSATLDILIEGKFYGASRLMRRDGRLSSNWGASTRQRKRSEQ